MTDVRGTREGRRPLSEHVKGKVHDFLLTLKKTRVTQSLPNRHVWNLCKYGERSSAFSNVAKGLLVLMTI